MTQEDLAQRVGVRRETIGNLEKGPVQPLPGPGLADRPSLFRPHRGNLHHRSIKQQDANRVLLFYVHKRIEAPIRNPPKGPTNLSVPPTRPVGQTQQVRAAARKRPKGPNQPFRPTDSPGRARPAGPGGSPAKPEGPNQPFHPTDSPGRARPAGLGGSPQKRPKGPNQPFHPTDSPGRANPAGPGGSRKGPKGLTNLSAPPTRPAGHASLSSAGRSRRKKFQSYFPRACTGEKIPLTPRVPAPPARFEVHPPILGGACRQADNSTPPYSALSNEGKPRVPLPKFPHSTLFSASTISKSRSFLRAVRFTAKEKTTVSTATHR